MRRNWSFLIVLLVAAALQTVGIPIVHADSNSSCKHGRRICPPGEGCWVCIAGWDPAELRENPRWVNADAPNIQYMIDRYAPKVTHTGGGSGSSGISIPSLGGNTNLLLIVGALVAGYLYLKSQSKGKRG